MKKKQDILTFRDAKLVINSYGLASKESHRNAVPALRLRNQGLLTDLYKHNRDNPAQYLSNNSFEDYR